MNANIFYCIELYMTVEGMVESMLKDYCRVIEENKYLNDELYNSNEVVRENLELIAILENSNEQTDQTKGIAENASSIGVPNDDCKIVVDELQQQLAERDQTIEDLMNKLKRSNVQKSNEANGNESDSNSMNVLDALQKLKNTINDFEKITEEIEGILNEKQNQLLGQQAQIDDLTKQLESKAEASNTDVESISLCMNKIKEMEEHNRILGNQTAMLDEQIGCLTKEYQKLMETTSQLMKSIMVCQKEISKYHFE